MFKCRALIESTSTGHRTKSDGVTGKQSAVWLWKLAPAGEGALRSLRDLRRSVVGPLRFGAGAAQANSSTVALFRIPLEVKREMVMPST